MGTQNCFVEGALVCSFPFSEVGLCTDRGSESWHIMKTPTSLDEMPWELREKDA